MVYGLYGLAALDGGLEHTMPDELLREWEDGHRLLKDRWQHIVCHPSGCRNARRPSRGERTAWQDRTYLTSMAGLQQELRECGLRLEAPKV